MSKLLLANWKANKNAATTIQWFADFSQTLEKLLNGQPLQNKVVIAPSYPLLSQVRTGLDELNKNWSNGFADGAGFELGVQDISPYGAGAYTGAVSGQNLAWLKPTTVILGHSERRRYFQESVQTVAAKLDQVLDLPALPVICVDQEQVTAQARAIGDALLSKVTVAYEPIAAIGTGVHPGVGQVQTVLNEIKRSFGSIPVLYGGSVDELTIAEYLLVSDGAIIGTAALDGTQFARVVAASQVSK
jgi:triosephosphate isomerase